MIKPLFYSLIWLMAICLIACTSPLSSEKITSLSLINAEIEIMQNPENKQANSIVVILRDNKGRRISNDSVSIIVNGVEASISQRQGLYYTNESGYILADVPVSATYKVDLKLPDQKIYSLGSVAALAEESADNITCDEAGDINKDFMMSWKGLKNMDELSVSISELRKNSPANEKNYNYRPQQIIKIGSSGTYTLSKALYENDTAVISGIEFDFRISKDGAVNPELLPGSKISIKTLIEKNVNFEE
ncbi:MAG: hypothetical protein JNM21_01585 [Taibaiella sp.]|nr:hypothetical protein [Taibaiella sp.]